MQLRAVAYPRYSSSNQREESLEAQMRAIEEYCRHRGYTLIGSYPDEAKSATTDNRPNFQRMIKDSDKKLFDVVVVHKLDRFARERYDSAFYKRILRKNGVRLESVLEQFDDSPESVILESVLEGMAEYYSKNLAREARKGMMENAIKGIHTGGRPPYGYAVDPVTRKLIIDEHAAKAVKMYFEGIAKKESLESIANRLNVAGYRTQSGRKFTKNSFDAWAVNRKYIGVYTWDVSTAKDQEGKRNSHHEKPLKDQINIPDAVPAIISKELFERVNAMMGERKRKPGQMKAKRVYLLTGKIVCGNPECGKDYRANSYTLKGKEYVYYKCTGNCGNKQVRKDDIESAVIREVLEVCFTDTAIRETVQAVKDLYQKQRKNDLEDIAPIQKEIAGLRDRMDAWLEALGDGLKSVLPKIKDAEERVEFLESELARMQMMSAVDDIDTGRIFAILEKQKNLLLSASDEAKKQVLDAYVERVVVTHREGKDDTHVDLKVRLFGGGGEPTPLLSLTRDRFFIL